MLNKIASSSCGVGFICNVNGAKTYDNVRLGIEAVKNLTHRGAVSADGKSGDGAGVLIQIPSRFFIKEIERLCLQLSKIEDLAVGFFFLYGNLENEVESIIARHGLKKIGWRDVPTDDDALGDSALSTKPKIRQLLLDLKGIKKESRELRLFAARKDIENNYSSDLCIPSLSSKIIVYKGLLVATQIDRFYPDLKDESLETSFCIFHQRFSTNTSPDWTLSQPFRFLAHNGEINTVQGNRNWVDSIENEIDLKTLGIEDRIIKPLVSHNESDSLSLERIVELLVLAGVSIEHAVNMCVPPVVECCDLIADPANRDKHAFFEYEALRMRPWDGPAAIVFTDGDIVGAHLDRNGMRPLRYTHVEGGLFILGSEAGMINAGGNTIIEKGRLGPGDTITVNFKRSKINKTADILHELAKTKPYARWIEKSLIRLKADSPEIITTCPDILEKQIAFGYTSEELYKSLKEMAVTSHELIYSMGDDTPVPALSEKPQLLFRYFRQSFSQVTNPPIDAIREKMVMSLKMHLGYQRSFLARIEENTHRIQIQSPVLFESDIREIEEQKSLRTAKISTTYEFQNSTLINAIEALRERVTDEVKKGAEIIILSDRDVSAEKAAIPSLLAISASYADLLKYGIANRASIIIETAEARDAHQLGCLIGYGASAICPYLAFHSIKDMCDRGNIEISIEKALLNYRKALDDGLLKIISKMGISVISCFHGSRMFDSVCLNRDFIDEYFHGTPVVIEADGLQEIEDSLMKRHYAAYGVQGIALDNGGELSFKKGGVRHGWSPEAVAALNKFIKKGDYALYKEFSRIVNDNMISIRHLFGFKGFKQVPIDEVEPEDSILKRFFSGAMSVGALSPEAHETIAEACNLLGIRSNCGEGGENPLRYFGIKGSAIKQIASGRFGVTPAYLASASELEIKIAQGAKPGEGGHLPAVKVTEYIAMLRHCRPNTLLISPPPHHDIYSIEDLAQLINDLKQSNPYAFVCVKLVSKAGVGTIAAGVAKAYADIVHISGCEGGTGAATISSIKHAGNYWETGLAETQRVLIESGLREKIKIRVDGGLKTGRDVVVAALLGAEEFGFGTAIMVSIGCVMARQCHSNTCPTGIATQDERLRKKFRGTVEGLMSYFKAVAREVREILSMIGCKSIDEAIGRSDLLDISFMAEHPSLGRIKLERLFEGVTHTGTRKCTCKRNDIPSPSMNEMLVQDLLPYIIRAERVEKQYTIRNIDRSVPVQLNYHIASRYKHIGLPPDTINLTFRGTAGQSFGAFNHKGLNLTLIGEANDYAGKGMFGGRIIIMPESPAESYRHVIVGNTVLYGAVGGEFFASGMAGERFAVRNSGATAIIEGTGQHLCEYMTGGEIIVLGEVGYNIGAGMTGGMIYIFDEYGKAGNKINQSYVMIEGIADEQDIQGLKELIIRHYKYTRSPIAGKILNDFDNMLKYFKIIIPLINNN